MKRNSIIVRRICAYKRVISGLAGALIPAMRRAYQHFEWPDLVVRVMENISIDFRGVFWPAPVQSSSFSFYRGQTMRSHR